MKSKNFYETFSRFDSVSEGFR